MTYYRNDIINILTTLFNIINIPINFFYNIYTKKNLSIDIIKIYSQIYSANTGIFIISSLYFTYPIIISLSKILYNGLKKIYLYIYNKIYNKIYKKNNLKGGLISFSKNDEFYEINNNYISGGYISKNNYYFIISDLKKYIENILLSFKINNNEIIPINDIKKYSETITNPYIILFLNNLDCLTKTNLFRNKKIKKDITEIWNNTNKKLKLPDISITPHYYQILNNSPYYQYGGDKDIIYINKDENIKIKCYSNIIYLFKKFLSKINKEKKIIDSKNIEKINKKIEILEKNELELEIFFNKNIENKNINIEELEKYKKIFEDTNKISNNLYIILFEIIKNY